MVFIPRWERYKDKKPNCSVEVDWGHELLSYDADIVYPEYDRKKFSYYTSGSTYKLDFDIYGGNIRSKPSDILTSTLTYQAELATSKNTVLFSTGATNNSANSNDLLLSFGGNTGGAFYYVSFYQNRPYAAIRYYDGGNVDFVQSSNNVELGRFYTIAYAIAPANTRYLVENGEVVKDNGYSIEGNFTFYYKNLLGLRRGSSLNYNAGATRFYFGGLLYNVPDAIEVAKNITEYPYQILKPRRKWYYFADAAGIQFLNSYSSNITNKNTLLFKEIKEFSNKIKTKQTKLSSVSSKLNILNVDDIQFSNTENLYLFNDYYIGNKSNLSSVLDLKVDSKTKNIFVNVSEIENKLVSKISKLFDTESLIVLNSENKTILSNSTLSSTVTFGKTVFIDSRIKLNSSKNIENSSLVKNKITDNISNDNNLKLLFVNSSNIESSEIIKTGNLIELDSALSYKVSKIIRIANIVSGNVFSNSYNLPFDSIETSNIIKTIILSNTSINNITSYIKLFHIDNNAVYNVTNTIQKESLNKVEDKSTLYTENILNIILNEVITIDNIERVQGIRNFDIRNTLKRTFNLDLDIKNLENILKQDVFSFYNKELKSVGFQTHLSSKEVSVIESKIVQVNNYYGEKFGFNININNITGFIHNGYFVIENFDNIIFIPLKSDSSIWILDSENNTWVVDIKNNTWLI